MGRKNVFEKTDFFYTLVGQQSSMNSAANLHVFISYVREDRRAVDKLCAELERNGIAVWLDREEIRPGERWEIAIRRAIEGGAFFIACFSKAYDDRGKSYMNVELTIAIDQLRLRPSNRAWFIPVLFQGGTVPDRPIGGGETLRDIQWVDLAEDWDNGVRRILSVLLPYRSVESIIELRYSTSAPEQLSGSELRRNFFNKLLATVTKHGGRTLVIYRDESFTADFPSASKAVMCALALQDEMRSLSDVERPEMYILIGCSMDPGPRPSQMFDLAKAGEILISESVLLGLGEVLGKIEIRERGQISLKDTADHVRVYEVRPAAAL